MGVETRQQQHCLKITCARDPLCQAPVKTSVSTLAFYSRHHYVRQILPRQLQVEPWQVSTECPQLAGSQVRAEELEDYSSKGKRGIGAEAGDSQLISSPLRPLLSECAVSPALNEVLTITYPQ